MGEGRPPCRPHIRRPGEGRPPCRPHIRRPWEGRPPRRPHFHVASGFIPRLCPWVRSVLAIRPGVKPVATSASGGTTSASSAFPRSERVYPAIMPLGEIRPGVKPVATSASGGMTSASSAHHRHLIVASPLAEAFHFNRGGTTSAPYSTNAISSSGRPSTKSPHR